MTKYISINVIFILILLGITIRSYGFSIQGYGIATGSPNKVIYSPIPGYIANKITYTELTHLAKQGNSAAQYDLGLTYYYGKMGIPQWNNNQKAAMFWFKKSAEQGNADAQFMLAQIYIAPYYQGFDYPKTYKKAFYWCEKSANQNNAGAQYLLGNMYNMGIGVVISHKKASYWWRKANHSAGY